MFLIISDVVSVRSITKVLNLIYVAVKKNKVPGHIYDLFS